MPLKLKIIFILASLFFISGCARYRNTQIAQQSSGYKCFHVAGVAKAQMNSFYHAHPKAPGLKTISCDASNKFNLQGHEYIFSDTYTDHFVGRNPYNIFTSYEVTVTGSICEDIPKLHFFVSNIKSNNKVSTENPILRNFFVYQSTSWYRYANNVNRIISKQCKNYKFPNHLKISIYAPSTLINSYRSKGIKVNGDNFGPFTKLYSGTYSTDYFSNKHMAWFDDDPIPRYESLKNEKKYQRKLVEINRMRQERNAALINPIAALSVGFIQGFLLEFADEGICAILASSDLSSFDKASYVRCHNYLYYANENLKQSSPKAFLVGNMLGMLNTSFSDFIEKGKTREGEAMRMGTAECLESITSEFGKSRYGETPSEKVIREGCAFGFGMGAAKGTMFPRK
jgi:Holliday junction resolvase RusA-like endonuclease